MPPPNPEGPDRRLSIGASERQAPSRTRVRGRMFAFMDSWEQMSVGARESAQLLASSDALQFRSSVSRSYYAAYAAVAGELTKRRVTFPDGRRNPPNADIPRYIANNLSSVSVQKTQRGAAYSPIVEGKGRFGLWATHPYQCSNGAKRPEGLSNHHAAVRTRHMSEHDIADIVREHAARQDTNGLKIEVIEGAVHKEGDWWHVPVRPLAPVTKRISTMTFS